MKTLNLKIRGGIGLNPLIQIDGKNVEYKKDKYEAIEINYKTESDFVDLKIQNVLEIKGKFWWLTQMFFFIISLFGILNPKLNKNLYSIDYQAKINLIEEQNDIVLKLNSTNINKPAIEIVGDVNVEEEVNQIIIDKEAKKRKKVLLISKIISWILLIVITALIIFFCF